MRETKPVQLEIFSSSGETPNREKRRPSFLEYIWGYEKTILILIGILTVSVVSFSLGVEKGKRMARTNAIQATPGEIRSDQAAIQSVPANTKTTPSAVQPAQKKEVLPTQMAKTAPSAVTPTSQKPSVQLGNFTIQIASYKTRKYAQAEADRLSKKGFTTIILPKGDYIALCVGRFASQNEAKLALQELQKNYKGCWIRRL